MPKSYFDPETGEELTEEEHEEQVAPDYGSDDDDSGDGGGGSTDSSSNDQDSSDSSLREGLEEVAQGGGRAARQAGEALTDIKQNNYNEQLALDDKERLQNELADRGINDGKGNVVVTGEPSEGEDVVSRGTGDTIEEARRNAAQNPNVDFDSDTPTGKKEKELGTNQPLANIEGSRPEAVQNRLQEIAGSDRFQGNKTGRQAGALAKAIEKGQDEYDQVDIQTKQDQIQILGRNTRENNNRTTGGNNGNQSVASLVTNNSGERSGSSFVGQDALTQNDFSGRQTRTDFASSFESPKTEGEQFEDNLQPVSDQFLLDAGFPVQGNQGRVTVTENKDEGLFTTLFGNETIEAAKANNPGLDVYDASPGSPEQGSTSTGSGIPTRQEFIDQNAEVTTAFEMNPGLYTAKQSEEALESLGLSEEAARSGGNIVGIGASYGNDAYQLAANPGQAVDNLAAAASNPAKVIDEATTEDLTPGRTTRQRQFQESKAFTDAIVTVGSAGSGSTFRGATSINKLPDLPSRKKTGDFGDTDIRDNLAVGEEATDTDVGSPGYSPGELASVIGEKTVRREVNALKNTADRLGNRKDNFLERTQELIQKADPATGVGRERRPGELTPTTTDLAEQRIQDLKDFVKGDIEPERTRRPEARELLLDEGVTVEGRQKADAIVDDTQLSQDADKIVVDTNSRGLSRAGNIPIEIRNRNRRDILIDKAENLADDINQRMNSGPVGSGPGALLKQKDLETKDKTPELDDTDFVRRIDDQDRRQDVASETIDDRLLRDRNRDRRRNDRTE